MLLQWDRVQEPYAHNFVQYRPVLNLTSTLAYNDTITPWTTLPVIPREIASVLVPAISVFGGAYYEFRLGFQSGLHTSLSNSLVAKTFDATSPFVNSIAVNVFDTIMSVEWGEPEYSDNIVGYAVRIYYRQLGNAGNADPQWGASGSTLVTSFQLPLTRPSFTYGCTDLTAKDCLTAYTTYLVAISVIRTTGQGAPSNVYVSTQHTIASLHNTSSIYLYALTITMNFTVNVPVYSVLTPINSTFLSPLSLRTTQVQDLNIVLTHSTVQSVSNTSIKVTLSLSEYAFITTTVYNRSFLFTPFLIEYGEERMLEPCSVYCLLPHVVNCELGDAVIKLLSQILTRTTVILSAVQSPQRMLCTMCLVGCNACFLTLRV